MDDRAAILQVLADWLERNELPDGAPANAKISERYGVLVGVHSNEAGFTGETVDEIVGDLDQARSLVAAHRARVVQKFTDEVEKVRLGIREGWLTGDDQLSLTAQAVRLPDAGQEVVIPVYGFAGTWVFSEVGPDRLVAADWTDHWLERLWSEDED